MKQRKQKPSKRRTHSAEFKARIALEGLKEIKTLNQIAQEEGLHPAQVTAWKKELKERLPELFATKGSVSAEREQAERNQARLERKVGQLLIEKEFLEKKCDQLGVDLSERP